MSHLVPSSPFILRDVSQNKVNFTVYPPFLADSTCRCGLAFSQGKWGEIHGLIIRKKVLETQHWLKFLSFFPLPPLSILQGKFQTFNANVIAMEGNPIIMQSQPYFLKLRIKFWCSSWLRVKGPKSHSQIPYAKQPLSGAVVIQPESPTDSWYPSKFPSVNPDVVLVTDQTF